MNEIWVKQKIEWLTARVNAMGGGGVADNELIWSNPSPTVAYNANTITFEKDLSTFRLIAFEYRLSTADETRSVKTIPYELLKEGVAQSIVMFNFSNTTPYRRSVKYINDNSVEYSTGYYSTSSASGAFVIPTKIYGIH